MCKFIFHILSPENAKWLVVFEISYGASCVF